MLWDSYHLFAEKVFLLPSVLPQLLVQVIAEADRKLEGILLRQ